MKIRSSERGFNKGMIILAFVCLGFLIGNLVGLSAESTLAIIIPLLFAFGGGSAVAFLHKLNAADRRLAALAVIALSLSCLIGVYSGIFVSERQLLSSGTPASAKRASIAERKYLRSLDLREADVIDQKFRNKQLTADDAYEQLYKLVLEGGTP